MEHEGEGQEQRQEDEVEERGRPEAGQEAPHDVEVAHRLHAVALHARLQGERDHDVKDAGRELRVEDQPDAGEEALADRVEQALQGEQEQIRTDRPISVGMLRLGMTRS
jgi:hypothetical protein